MINRLKQFALVGVLCAGATPARALFFDAGARETVGNQNYRGEYGYVDFGGDLHLRPSFSAYHDDLSSGTYKTISARLAYDRPRWGLGVTGGGTPVVDDYSNRFFGADVTFRLLTESDRVARHALSPDTDKNVTPDGDSGDGWGLARFDLGAGYTRTYHSTSFRSGFVGVIPDSSTINIVQNDYRGTIRAKLLRNLLTVDVTQTLYDHSLATADSRAQVQNLAGLDANIQGFPKLTAGARLDFSMIPVVVPFISYTHTTFELQQPNLYAYQAGAYLDIKFIEISASYQRITQAGYPTLNLTSLGAGINF